MPLWRASMMRTPSYPLSALREELSEREAFSKEQPPEEREGIKKYRGEKKANTDRLKELKRELKGLERLEAEAEEKRTAARQQAEREIALAREAAADLLRICSDPTQSGCYFAVAERPEIEENEFNLHLPRYVDSFEPEEGIEISDALKELTAAEEASQNAARTLRSLLRLNGTK